MLLNGKTEVTGDAQVFREFAVGAMALKAGEQTLLLQSTAAPGAVAMNLEAIVLKPMRR